jgi:PhnB protein
MQVEPYLNFEGRCEEALAFYQKALGAEILVCMRYSDNPEPPAQSMTPPGSEKKIMHAAFRVGSSTLMASDGRCLGASKFEGISLTLTLDSEEAAKRAHAALTDGGETVMPLQRTFFSPAFGMARDRFGVHWMILTQAAATA